MCCRAREIQGIDMVIGLWHCMSLYMYEHMKLAEEGLYDLFC